MKNYELLHFLQQFKLRKNKEQTFILLITLFYIYNLFFNMIILCDCMVA